MSKLQMTKTELADALWDLDETHGGFRTKVSAVYVLGHLSERLPSLELEESGDLYRIYDPLTEQYLWPEKTSVAAFNEAVDKLASDIIVATGKQPTDLPIFQFTISREVTESATVRVRAATIEQAQRMALRPEFYTNYDNAPFAFDDGNVPPVPYLPAGGEYDIIETIIAPLDFSQNQALERGEDWDVVERVTSSEDLANSGRPLSRSDGSDAINNVTGKDAPVLEMDAPGQEPSP